MIPVVPLELVAKACEAVGWSLEVDTMRLELMDVVMKQGSAGLALPYLHREVGEALRAYGLEIGHLMTDSVDGVLWVTVRFRVVES